MKRYEGIFSSLIEAVSEMTQTGVRAGVFGSVSELDSMLETMSFTPSMSGELNSHCVRTSRAVPRPIKRIFTGKVDKVCSGLLYCIHTLL